MEAAPSAALLHHFHFSLEKVGAAIACSQMTHFVLGKGVAAAALGREEEQSTAWPL